MKTCKFPKPRQTARQKNNNKIPILVFGANMNRTRLHPLSLALIAALSHTATAQTGEQT